ARIADWDAYGRDGYYLWRNGALIPQIEPQRGGENWSGRLAALSRRFIMRQMSMPLIALVVGYPVRRKDVRNRGPSLIPAASMYPRRICSRSCPPGISRALSPFSENRRAHCVPSCWRLLSVSLATAPTRSAVSISRASMARSRQPTSVKLVAIWVLP